MSALEQDVLAAKLVKRLRRLPGFGQCRIVRPVNRSASWILGVMTEARGIRACLTASIASACSRSCPLFETMTGSTTIQGTWYCCSFRPTRDASEAEDSIPVLTAATSKSAKIASICASTIGFGEIVNGRDACGILCGNRRNHRHGIGAVSGHGFQVRLDPGAATRVGTGDGQDLFQHGTRE